MLLNLSFGTVLGNILGEICPAEVCTNFRSHFYDLKNHRKIMVFDGHTAILGGRNIGLPYFEDEYTSPRYPGELIYVDMDVVVSGPAAVQVRSCCSPSSVQVVF